VELLVVIGLIAMLIGMLLPAIRKAQISARKTVCASHLQQVGIGVLLYAHENRGTLPTPESQGTMLYSFDRAPESVYPPGNPRPIESLMLRYCSKNREVFFCPEYTNAGGPGPDDYWKAVAGTSTQHLWSDNVMGYLYLGARYHTPSKRLITEWNNPPYRINLIYRAKDKVGVGQPMMTDMTSVSPYWPARAQWAHVGPKTEGANQLFADGHVAWKHPKEIGFTPNSPSNFEGAKFTLGGVYWWW
jgi:prepilin-type processing-associated H-X9-DG protein